MLELLEAQAVQPTSGIPDATYEDLKAVEEEAMFRGTTLRIPSPPAPAASHNPELPAPAVYAPSDSNAPVVDPVPAEMRSRAEKLDTHDWVLSIFDKALYRIVKRWPKQDKIDDQLARYKLKEWHSNPSDNVPAAGASAAGGKRLRGSQDSDSGGGTRAPRAKKAKKGKKGKATKRANDDGSTEADEVQEPVTKRTRKAQRAKEAQEPVQTPERSSWQGPFTRSRHR
ncbi:hypothetical protein C8Q74DRAFT_1288562 [Fomes fomentarius]|nr:hypothetical protein C8Q74DRAFT_1288562 [Fomes fomentarius]